MSTRIYIILLLLVSYISSCTNDMEENIDDNNNYNQDPLPSTDQLYYPLFDLIDDEGWWFLAQELSSDEFCGPTRDADWDDGGKWRKMHRHTWSNMHEGVYRMWDELFGGILSANQLTDILKTYEVSDSVKALQAEANVLHSFYYYLLLDNYGHVPYLTSNQNAPQQPFRLSKEKIFDSLVIKITEALPYLPLADHKYKITKYTAYALLAKLYLNSEVYTGTPEWTKAEMYIDSVIQGPYALTSYVGAPFITDNENSSEIIFSIPFDEDMYPGFRLHMRTLHYQHNLMFDMAVGPWNGLCITPDQWNRYSSSDIRRNAFNIYGEQFDVNGYPIIDGATEDELIIDPVLPALEMYAQNFSINEFRNSGARVGKYEIKIGAKENLSNDFPLFRLSDFYLMKAEVRIRQGGDGAGDAYITPIRTRAGISTAAGFGLDSLLDERARELYVEGHRRQDLIRFDKFTEPWWEKGGSYEGNSGDPTLETFPIPQWAIDNNPNLLEDPQ
jgi:hypothetical protein